jgi:hypothetical protein
MTIKKGVFDTQIHIKQKQSGQFTYIGTQDTTNKMTMYAKKYKIIRKHSEDIN